MPKVPSTANDEPRPGDMDGVSQVVLENVLDWYEVIFSALLTLFWSYTRTSLKFK